MSKGTDLAVERIEVVKHLGTRTSAIPIWNFVWTGKMTPFLQRWLTR